MTMAENRTIVAAIDTTDVSRAVFKESLVLASSTNAKVVLVAVTPQYEGNMNRLCIKDAVEQFSKPFKQVLQEAEEYAHSLGLKLQTVHRSGKPGDEITAVAVETQASIILLGCTRRSQIERMLLGRTMMDIIGNCPCDVLLIPEGGTVGFRKLLVGLNGKASSLAAAERVLDVATCYGSDVHAIYAIDIPPDRSLRYGVQKEAEQKGRIILQRFNQMATDRQLSATTSIHWGAPEKGLVDYSVEKDIQLIVLCSKHHAGMLDGLWDSVVEGVSAKTSCPVLVTKKREKETVSRFPNLFS